MTVTDPKWFASGGGIRRSGPYTSEEEAREALRYIQESDAEWERLVFDWAQRERQRIQSAIANWTGRGIVTAIDCGVRSITIDVGDPEPRPVRRGEFPADLRVWSEQ